MMALVPDAPPQPESHMNIAPAPVSPSPGQRVLGWVKEALIMAAIAGAVLAVIAIFKSPGGGKNVAVAEVAPDFDLARSDGRGRVTSTDLRGKPVVLTFWATWCPTCRDEMPELDLLHRRAGDEITIVTVSREAPRTVLGYAHKKGLSLPLYTDDAVFAAYGIESIPTTIVIAADGTILAELSGTEDADTLEGLARGSPR